MFLFAVALNPITGICFINGLCPCSRLTGDAGFANERIEIHVVHINYLGDAGKPLEAGETFIFILLLLLCLNSENEFGAVGLGWFFSFAGIPF